jgi:hypothetical protein
LTAPVSAQNPGNADAARSVIVEQCTKCHLVPGVKRHARWSPVTNAPSFRQIADDSHIYTRDRLAKFLGRPHYPMVSIILSPSDIQNLLAFIDGLRAH